jgi:hypothetical protein
VATQTFTPTTAEEGLAGPPTAAQWNGGCLQGKEAPGSTPSIARRMPIVAADVDEVVDNRQRSSPVAATSA